MRGEGREAEKRKTIGGEGREVEEKGNNAGRETGRGKWKE